MKNVILALLLSAGIAFAGGNPKSASVTIKGKQHQALRAYFKEQGSLPEELTPPIEKILLNSLPKRYQTGCAQMVSRWGQKAKGTETMLPRPLHMITMPDGTIYFFAAYTCFSKLPTLGDRYYHERLALIAIGASSSTLTMLPTPPACEECKELARLGLQDDTLKIGGIPAITIAAGVSNDNPCCPESTTVDEKHLSYFLIGEKAVTPVADVLEYRKETVHRPSGGDSTAVFSGSRFLERDAKGNVTKIITEYELTVNDQPVRRGMTSLVWNPKRKAFEEQR